MGARLEGGTINMKNNSYSENLCASAVKRICVHPRLTFLDRLKARKGNKTGAMTTMKTRTLHRITLTAVLCIGTAGLCAAADAAPAKATATVENLKAVVLGEMAAHMSLEGLVLLPATPSARAWRL